MCVLCFRLALMQMTVTSYCIALDGFELLTLLILPPLPTWWDYRQVLPLSLTHFLVNTSHKCPDFYLYTKNPISQMIVSLLRSVLNLYIVDINHPIKSSSSIVIMASISQMLSARGALHSVCVILFIICWSTLLSGQRSQPPRGLAAYLNSWVARSSFPQESLLLSTCPYLEGVPGPGGLTFSRRGL